MPRRYRQGEGSPGCPNRADPEEKIVALATCMSWRLRLALAILRYKDLAVGRKSKAGGANAHPLTRTAEASMVNADLTQE